MRRLVAAEILDDLPPGDPRAAGSRGDLQRLNYLMGHTRILSRAFLRHREEMQARSRPLRVVELGAGDGTLLLRLARRWSALGVTAQVTLLDRHNLVSAETRHAFAALHWDTECVVRDVFDWLSSSAARVDVMFANLFLHHFQGQQLGNLLRLAAAKTNLFIACEPRRSPLALIASQWLFLLGCNAVTRHDAVVSVRAGFAGGELTTLWPANASWELNEQPAGWFSHTLVAKRNA
jgi:hypothetical protein